MVIKSAATKFVAALFGASHQAVADFFRVSAPARYAGLEFAHKSIYTR